MLLQCSKGDKEEERRVRHEERGVPMSRMENDPPLHSGVSRSSRFPSIRHFPAYSAMIQFGCAFLRPLRQATAAAIEKLRRWEVTEPCSVTPQWGMKKGDER